MPNEVAANQVLPDEAGATLPEVALSEPDYRAFCAALEASARGRAFLAEYARRNRHADTETVLAALERLETLVRSQAATSEADRIRQELRALLAALHGAQPVIDASAAAIKAAKLAALIGFVQHRIESIVAPAREAAALPPEVAALILLDAEPASAAEAVRAHLAVVPRADEPELPMPAPAAGPPPAIALVQSAPKEPPPAQVMIQPVPEIAPPVQEVTTPAPEIVQRSVASIPEVNLFDGAPAQPAAVEPVIVEPVLAAPTLAAPTLATPVYATTFVAERIIAAPAAIETQASESAAAPPPVFELMLPPPVKRPADPLAHIMALSDEERIALFS